MFTIRQRDNTSLTQVVWSENAVAVMANALFSTCAAAFAYKRLGLFKAIPIALSLPALAFALAAGVEDHRRAARVRARKWLESEHHGIEGEPAHVLRAAQLRLHGMPLFEQWKKECPDLESLELGEALLQEPLLFPQSLLSKLSLLDDGDRWVCATAVAVAIEARERYPLQVLKYHVLRGCSVELIEQIDGLGNELLAEALGLLTPPMESLDFEALEIDRREQFEQSMPEGFADRWEKANPRQRAGLVRECTAPALLLPSEVNLWLLDHLSNRKATELLGEVNVEVDLLFPDHRSIPRGVVQWIIDTVEQREPDPKWAEQAHRFLDIYWSNGVGD